MPISSIQMKLHSPGNQYHTQHPCKKRGQRRGWVRLWLTWESYSPRLFWQGHGNREATEKGHSIGVCRLQRVVAGGGRTLAAQVGKHTLQPWATVPS